MEENIACSPRPGPGLQTDSRVGFGSLHPPKPEHRPFWPQESLLKLLAQTSRVLFLL